MERALGDRPGTSNYPFISDACHSTDVRHCLTTFNGRDPYIHYEIDDIPTALEKQKALLSGGELRVLAAEVTTVYSAVALVDRQTGKSSRGEQRLREHLGRYLDDPRTLLALAAFDRGHVGLDRLFGFVDGEIRNPHEKISYEGPHRIPSRQEVAQRRHVAGVMLQSAASYDDPKRQAIVDRATSVLEVVEAIVPEARSFVRLTSESRAELKALTAGAPSKLADATTLAILAADVSDEAAEKGWNLVLSVAHEASSEEMSRAVSKLASAGDRQLAMAHRLEAARAFLSSDRAGRNRGLARWTSSRVGGSRSNAPKLTPVNEAEFLRAYAKHGFTQSAREAQSSGSSSDRAPTPEPMIVVNGRRYQADDVLFALRESMRAALHGGDFDDQLGLDAATCTKLGAVDSGVIRIVAGVDVALTSKMFDAVTQTEDLGLAAPSQTLLTAKVDALGPLAAFVRDRHLAAVDAGRRRTSALVELVSQFSQVAPEKQVEPSEAEQVVAPDAPSVADESVDQLVDAPTDRASDRALENVDRQPMEPAAVDMSAETDRPAGRVRRPQRRTALPGLTTSQTPAGHQLTPPSFLARGQEQDGSVDLPDASLPEENVVHGNDLPHLADVRAREERGTIDL